MATETPRSPLIPSVVRVFYQNGLWVIEFGDLRTYTTTEVDAKYRGIAKAKELGAKGPCTLVVHRIDGSLKSCDTYPEPTDLVGRKSTKPAKKMAEGKAE